MRIGVFGGSFDPVHRGHLAVAQQAIRQIPLDEVRFVPARLQPLKATGPRASADHRVAMLRLAIAGQPAMSVDPREIERPGPSYTVDTLRALRVEHPGDRLFLLVGADAARDLPRWRDADEISKLATVVVVPRDGEPGPDGAVKLAMEPVNLSATSVREAAATELDIEHLVPKAVAAYIAVHQLYRMGA